MEPLTSIDAALAALQSARGATSGLGTGRKARRTACSKAHSRLVEATTQAIVTAEYFAALARLASTQQRQGFGLIAVTSPYEPALQRHDFLQRLHEAGMTLGPASHTIAVSAVLRTA